MKKMMVISMLILPVLAHAQLRLPDLGKKKYFTNNSKLEYEYYDVSLADVQFYLSGEILLKREIDKGVSVSDNNRGKVKFENGKTYIYYQFDKYEACVFEYEDAENNIMGMRLDEGDKMTLPFQITPETAQDETRYFQLSLGEDKKVWYGGVEYELVYGDRVQLMFKEKKKGKAKTDKTRSKGMKVKKRKGGG